MKTKQQLWSTKSPIWALWWDPPPTSKVWGCLVVLRLSACPTLAWRLNRNIIKYVIIILESIFVYLSRRLQKGIWNKISFKKHYYKRFLDQIEISGEPFLNSNVNMLKMNSSEIFIFNNSFYTELSRHMSDGRWITKLRLLFLKILRRKVEVDVKWTLCKHRREH